MKKFYSIAMLAVAAMAAFSCNKEIIVDEATAPVNAPKVVTAYTDADVTPATKTTLDGVTVLWSESDAVTAFTLDGNLVTSSSTAVDKSGKKAEFTFRTLAATDEIDMYAYPADAVKAMDGYNDLVTASIPTEQAALAGSFADGANLAVAEGGDEPVFKNVGGFVSFTLQNEDICSIRLSAKEALTGGSAAVTVSDNPSAVVTEGKKEVIIAAATAPLASGSTYYAVVYPGTYTGLQIVFTDSKGRTATFNNPNALTVSRNANLSIWSMSIPDSKWVDAPVVDILNNAWTGITGNSYAAKTLNGSASKAVYSVQAAGDKSSIQLRSNGSTSGVVTTTSGGKLKSISIKWISDTDPARVVDVYAKNTAYSAPSDLYSSSSQGTKVASFTCSDGDNSYTFTDDYEFIGFRSKSGALYIDEIQIAWTPAASKLDPGMSWSETEATATINDTGIDFDAPVLTPGNATNITYESTNTAVATISTDGVVSIVAAGTTTIKAIFAGDDTYSASTVSYDLTVTDNSTPAPTTIADVLAGGDGTYTVPNVMVYAVKGNALIIGDETAKMYAYKSSHGLSVGDVRTLSGTAEVYGGVFEFNGPEFTGTGTAEVNHGDALVLDDVAEDLKTAFSGRASAVYVHAIGQQSSRNITTGGNNVLYLSAPESATDEKTVEVYGYVYAYSTSHSNFNFLVTSIKQVADAPSLSITPATSSSAPATWASDNNDAKAFTVTAENGSWEVTANTISSWADYSVSGNTITVTPKTAQAADNYSGTLTVTLTPTNSGFANVVKTIYLKQTKYDASAPVAVFDFSGAATDSEYKGTTVDGYTLTVNANCSTNKDGTFRAFKNTGKFTISGSGITKIVFEFVDTYEGDLSASVGDYSSGIWTGDAVSSVQFSNGGGAGQARITKFSVYSD